MKLKRLILTSALCVLCLTGCGAAEPVQPFTYEQISAEEARRLMDEHPDSIVLDVREAEEYEAGHIPGAVLLPVGSISGDTAAAAIPETDSLVLVYCRSGRRSKLAAEALAGLGYSNVKEFGGILGWPYAIE